MALVRMLCQAASALDFGLCLPTDMFAYDLFPYLAASALSRLLWHGWPAFGL